MSRPLNVRKVVRRAGRLLPGSTPSEDGPGRVEPTPEDPSTPKPAVKRRPEDWQNAKDFGYAYRGLLAAVFGKRPGELGNASIKAPDKDADARNRKAAEEVRARASFTQLLVDGVPLEDALATTVRGTFKARDHLTARSISQSLQANPTTAVAGHLGSALVAQRTHLPELAWASFAHVPTAMWQRLAAVEYFRAAFAVDREAALGEARRILVERPAELHPVSWLELVELTFAAGEEALAEELFTVAERLAADDPASWASTTKDRAWLAPWFDQALRPEPAPEVPAGQVAIGVIDYKQPERVQTSTNLGDYTQTISMLGHLVRHQGVRFHGPADLVDTVTELQGRVRPERRLDSGERDVTLVPFNRDASSYDSIPDHTWAIAFGWYMQSIFGRHDFPFHPHLRPIFVSFHCNRPAMLTPQAREYLRTHGPIGCRDWNTVDLLLSADIPAFFSGCITTTVDTVFPDLADAPAADRPVAYVDVDAPEGERFITQAGDEVRHGGLVPNLRAAVQMLEDYRRDYSRLVTTRLHCYLPATSVGVPVDFTPKNRADVRFNGLFDLTPDRLAEMRQGILDKLEPTVTAILDGKSDDEVYAVWREVCADAVAEAEERRRTVPEIVPPSFDVAAACSTVRAAETLVEASAPERDGDTVHVALALDGNLKDEMSIVVEAMADNCSRPLHLWVLCRDHDQADFDRLARLFPQVTFSWLPCDSVDYGDIIGMLRHITVSTMDRLLLPDLLPELDRIVYHDIDALPLGDVAELFDWDLDGHPIAARSAVSTRVKSGYANIYLEARRLRDDAAAAHDLLHRMHARHPYDFHAFNAGILVLDLQAMRADDFCRHYIPFVEQYGMNDQEVLNCYAGAGRVVLPPAWNSFPTQEVVAEPNVIHWAGPLKPWNSEYVLFREEWLRYGAQVHERAERLPTTNPAKVDELINEVCEQKLTYLTPDYLHDLVDAVSELEQEGRPGAIIEAGTALGGSAIVLAAVKALGRPMYVYDAFGMIPPPTDEDGEDVKRRYEKIRSGGSAGLGGETYYGYREDLLGEVTASFERFGLPVGPTNVELVKGYFQDTLDVDYPVALAHLDGDWYESTMVCLERIVPRLVPGGRLVIDDYDYWAGCRKAVDEYFDGRTGFEFRRLHRMHIIKL